MTRLSSPKAFTLIELLIVVVVLAALAATAIPLYERAIEKSRKSEALEALSSVRRSQIRYYSENRTFAQDLSRLDFDPDEAAVFQTVHFNYAILEADVTGFTAAATRNTVDGGDGTSTVTIDEAGVIGGTFGGN